MDQYWKSMLGALAPGILIAVVTAWVTVRLALHQFAAQRLWEKKLHSYEEILVALHNMKRYSEAYVESYERQREFSEVEQKLSSPRREAQATLNRSIDIGELYVSATAVGVLRDLQVELMAAIEEHDFYSTASAEIAALEKTLGKLLVISTQEVKR